MRLKAAKAAAAAGGCGEIVEVEGGHIVRSMGRKDRHSKVCTAKGPRDRRVRLSAPTAIQFYDVQDRLGFDRPSKAVDWLINKAKSAIDELAELPPWNPADTLHHAKPRRPAKTQASPPHPPEPHSHFISVAGDDNGSGFPAESLGSDSIADTMKSLFPVGGGACDTPEAPPPPQQLMQQPDLLSRTSSHSQDLLRLSLQFSQDAPPLLLHHHHNLFAGGINNSAWEHSPEIGGGRGGGGLVFASPPQPVLSQSQLGSSQRGPLQSINTPLIRAWFDPQHHHPHIADLHNHSFHVSSVVPGIGFASQIGEFCIPARFQGHEEEHGGFTTKPSSAFPVSRH